jgi:ABC-type branched-subunit amino acid transport system substrate-binding protein
MPRFLLDENATKIMVFYLKNLSREFPPGVGEDEIRFATILTEDVSPLDKDALLLPMKAYISDEWNGRLSVLAEQSSALWYGKDKPVSGKTYRKASLDVWELKGPADTWGKQLAAFYEQRPVFAILGGIATGKWAPIHEFCEKNKIPCVFPFTDLPVISETDWYTLYFSKGFYQEGETAAKYLAQVSKLPPGKKVVQVYRNSDEGSAMARGFAETWKKLGKASLTDMIVSQAEKTGKDFWKNLAATHPNSVILIWLGPADLSGLDSLAKPGNKATLFVSSTMLAGALTSIPDKVRDFTFITWPTRLPDDEQYTKAIVTNWMQMKKIPVTNMTISSKVFCLTRLLSKTLMDLRGDFYRDFLLDIMDSGDEQATSSVTYPLLSFRQGQRYASTGCYVVTLPKGEKPKVVRKSEWIIN